MSDRLLCRKWGGNKKEIRNSEDDGKEKSNWWLSWSIHRCLTSSKTSWVSSWQSGQEIQQLLSSVLGSASPQLIFSLWATKPALDSKYLSDTLSNVLSRAADKVALLFLLLPPSRQPHEPPQGHQSPPASGLHGGNYLCSLRAHNPSIESLLSSPPRPPSLLFPSVKINSSFIVSFVWNI